MTATGEEKGKDRERRGHVKRERQREREKDKAKRRTCGRQKRRIKGSQGRKTMFHDRVLSREIIFACRAVVPRNRCRFDTYCNVEIAHCAVCLLYWPRQRCMRARTRCTQFRPAALMRPGRYPFLIWNTRISSARSGREGGGGEVGGVSEYY